MQILVINGPNLNLLGQREPEHYGNFTLEDVEKQLVSSCPDVDFQFYQSNVEGELINRLHDFNGDGIIINAGGYTHTSVALADALKAIKIQYVEVHISNIYSREEYRRTSLISEAALGVISGFGLQGYLMAANYFNAKIR